MADGRADGSLRAADGTEALYASVVENRREGKRTVQTTVVNIGRVTEEQVPYLRAAWSERKPRLVWDEPSDGAM